MFKHILLPTDGSDSSDKATQAAVRMAREMNAKVTAVHVVPPFHTFTYRPDMIEDTEEQYEIDSEAVARKILSTVEQQARVDGVVCESVVIRSDDIWQSILHTATERNCDLIAMASHGRSGVRALLLGSETQKVLTHSQVPVLVFR
ncbi:universal stress protein [Massilia cavernae]|uniref:Universal stress protein n=1 Tax=Massilia cavernae TaxID=2320864 RepID=A0A418XFM4_9BURK|nr:universal stress protein [Massilia cavernae]RJG11262.1 universal stress protein [Massilia cavernae]